MIQYKKTSETLSVLFRDDFEVKQVSMTNPHADAILAEIRNGTPACNGTISVNEARLRLLFDRAAALRDYVERVGVDLNGHRLVAAGGNVTWDGETLGGVVVDRILQFMAAGRPVKPLATFLARLMANPSFNSRQQLYSFLEAINMPITENGTFLACKGVTADYTDVHTGSYVNKPGFVHVMDRKLVDDNPNNHCSAGFHVGAWEYARSFGAHVMLVEVDPADVVSVPADYNAQKCRTCKYKVLFEMTEPLLGDFHPLAPKPVPAKPEHVCPTCGEDLDEQYAEAADEGDATVCCPNPDCKTADICVACGKVVVPTDANFCSECGADLNP